MCCGQGGGKRGNLGSAASKQSSDLTGPRAPLLMLALKIFRVSILNELRTRDAKVDRLVQKMDVFEAQCTVTRP